MASFCFGNLFTSETAKQKEAICTFLNSSHVKQSPLDSISEVVDVSWIRSAAYAFVGSLSASLSFRAALPEALSLAPGLLAAAIRIKVVAPLSYLPGVFIIIMPLLFVPMIWSFCIVVIQSFSDLRLLVGVTSLVLSQSTYMWLGVRWNVASPMSRQNAEIFAHTVKRYER